MVNDRVEAAEKIRGYGEWLDVYSYTSAAPKAIDRLRDAIINTYDYAVLLDHLADLIDPTCKPMITVEILTESLTKYTSECSECSECGAIFGDFPTREQAETTHPTYCPCCGSRVITPNSGKDNDSEC